MTYNEFIQNIINTRGQWSISQGEYFEAHHIIPRCLGGTGSKKTKHKNIIWLYPREHFVAHKLLAEENPTNYKLVYAYHMMSTMSKDDRRNVSITPEEYEQAKLLWLPFCKEMSSKNTLGTHWYNDGTTSFMSKECPDGCVAGRCESDKLSIGKSSIGRITNRGTHWYTNGVDQIMAFECPDGWWAGTLPMTESAKESHRNSMIDKDLVCKHVNRGYETLNDFSERINRNEFEDDFIKYKMSDSDLALKYNCTKRMIEKYRRANNLYKSLWKE